MKKTWVLILVLMSWQAILTPPVNASAIQHVTKALTEFLKKFVDSSGLEKELIGEGESADKLNKLVNPPLRSVDDNKHLTRESYLQRLAAHAIGRIFLHSEIQLSHSDNRIKNWSLHEIEDGLDGSISRFAWLESEEALDGWLYDENRKISLWKFCEQDDTLLVGSSNMLFESDNNETQRIRIKIDDNPVVMDHLWISSFRDIGGVSRYEELDRIYYETTGKLPDHQTASSRSLVFPPHSFKNIEKQFLTGKVAKIEVEMLNLDYKQIATFAIDGFADVIAWCEKEYPKVRTILPLSHMLSTKSGEKEHSE